MSSPLGTLDSGPSVEAMFAQILGAVQKSVGTSRPRVLCLTTWLQQAEIAELRHECADLRQANASLERQIREGLQVRSTQI